MRLVETFTKGGFPDYDAYARVTAANPDARLEVFGQDYNAQAYAICGSDMMIKGQNPDNITRWCRIAREEAERN